MLESDKSFTQTIIHICESIFYHYLRIYLMRIKKSSFPFKASRRVLLGLKYLNFFFIIFDWKKGLILLLQKLHLKLGILTKYELNDK